VGLTDEQLAGVTEAANTRMKEAVDQTVEVLISQTGVPEGGRKNELRIELRGALSAIANRIDIGYNIDVRANEPEPSGEAVGAATDNAAYRPTLPIDKSKTPRANFGSSIERVSQFSACRKDPS
jgi:hypothetical protein